MDLQNLTYRFADHVAVLTVNRPEKRNTLTLEMRQEIKAVLERVRQDEEVRVLVITGAGDKAFIAGADVTTFKEATPLEIRRYVGSLGQMLYNEVELVEVPVIAMINGYCLGGGLELAMACDLRIASTNARFGQPEILIGIIPGGGGTQRLPRLVGMGKAKELIYTGEMIDAEEAFRIGLIDRLTPPENLEPTTMALAQKIAARSPVLVKLAKRAVNQSWRSGLDEGLAYEREIFSLGFSAEDRTEGVTAFLEKRPPRFQGR